MRLRNTETGAVQPLEPVDRPVGVYVCGITPYDTTHLGHAFTYTHFDVLVRLLPYWESDIKEDLKAGKTVLVTAHGNSLENLLVNPTLNDLLGGIQTVTLSDEEARRRGTQKSVLERKAPPTFDVLVEIQDRDRVAII